MLCVAIHLATSYPHSRYANILKRRSDVQDKYDYVIIGGGTAGLTVGDRLSENGKHTVLVIEAGALDDQSGFPGNTNSSRMFNIRSTSQRELNNRDFWVGIGKVVGGSSNVNGQVFLRGTKEEYDIWKKLGGPHSTWDWTGLLPYFKRAVHFTPPDPGIAKEFNITYDLNAWGQDPRAKIYATFSNTFKAGMKILYNAMRNMPGVDVPIDGAGGANGLLWFTTSMDPKTYLRSYARTGHWDGLNRTNYELIPNTRVSKPIFEGTAVIGVEYGPATHGVKRTVRAMKEVILAAGTVHTPQILQLSGIGPEALLEEANITAKVNLPGVGMNFQDHSYIPSISYSWGKVPPEPPLNHTIPIGGSNPVLGAFLGLPAITPNNYEILANRFSSQAPETYLPVNVHPTVVAGYAKQKQIWAEAMRSKGVTFLEYIMSDGPGGSVQNLHCASRGTIMIDVANPQGEMIVDYRAGTNPIDIDVMVENIKFMRRFMTTGELAQYEAVELSPGISFDDDEKLAGWAREHIIPSVFHPVGTAAMMPRELGGVVDDKLLVYGVQGLSVVDASIMPTIVGATTSMTVYAVAEKAADMIKARA
ncbi:alcohol oxidase [Pseudovirgaria hyperparasitica]|uniref:Alcohol oxidase n=1 Tax=Pseudovirgaria hyperparasitica TaxID=470096 RepID=A0A6A6WK43_9PEZI|nr:alcohol oxidase [Pseudovirgaria hyperparasitica]KAF2762311.1 alcohol oxidase [Pseudovirgaria hyperparasitica]